MALVLPAEAYSNNAPSVCQSAGILSTFKHTLKAELFDIAHSEHKHSAYSLPLSTSNSPATW